jgi:hypothetical protein
MRNAEEISFLPGFSRNGLFLTKVHEFSIIWPAMEAKPNNLKPL